MKKIISNTIFIIIVLFLLSHILVDIFIPEKTIDIFGFKTYVIVSSSMDPDIKINDLVVITKVKEEKLEVDDVITFKVYIPELQEYSYVTHYIGEINTDEDTIIYETQGANKDVGDYDNWTDDLGNDYDITYNDIEGKMLFKIPYAGYVSNIFKDPILLGLVILNIGIIVLIIKLIKSTKKESN